MLNFRDIEIMHKLYFFVLTIIMTFTALSQEMDEEFLKSLPEDIREDILERTEEKESREEKVYRSIDITTDIKKEDLIEDIFGSEFFTKKVEAFSSHKIFGDLKSLLKFFLLGRNSFEASL